MGAPEANTTLIYGIHIRESANDGSDFSNGATDYRVLFLGEDGQLHVKDSAGTVTDIGGGSGNVATDTIWDAAGDLAQGTGSNTAARLAAGTAGQFLMANGSSTAVSWASSQLDYVEVTSNTNLTATTEATANTVVTGSAIAYDGSTAVMIEFFAPTWQGQDTLDAVSRLYLYDGSSSIGRIATLVNPTGDSGGTGLIVPVFCARRLTPSAATHTYSIRGDTSTGTAVVGAGAGGNGNVMPGFIRITRAA